MTPPLPLSPRPSTITPPSSPSPLLHHHSSKMLARGTSSRSSSRSRRRRGVTTTTRAASACRQHHHHYHRRCILSLSSFRLPLGLRWNGRDDGSGPCISTTTRVTVDTWRDLAAVCVSGTLGMTLERRGNSFVKMLSAPLLAMLAGLILTNTGQHHPPPLSLSLSL